MRSGLSKGLGQRRVLRRRSAAALSQPCSRSTLRLAAALFLLWPGPARAGGGAATDSYEDVAAGAISLSGLVDTYVLHNFNDPASGMNQLRAFDLLTNAPTLNYARLTLAHKPGHVGFRLDAGLGATSGVFAQLDPEASQYSGLAQFWSHIEQAFVTWSVPEARGFSFDLGKFDTPVGWEDNVTAPNWNYSRSFLFTEAEPTLNTGLRLTVEPVGETLGLSVFWVNGWNANIRDGSDMRSFAGAATWRPREGLELTSVYMGGLERPPDQLSNPALGFRNLIDVYVIYSPSKAASFAATIDYGHDQASGGVNWGGLAVYARGRPLSWLTGALRAEIYADPDGFTTGRSQLLAEVTGTLDATIPFGRGALVARLEYRHDQSNAPVFDTGIPAIRTFQDTLTLALVVGQ